MKELHKEILNKNQNMVFKIVEDYSKQGFYLAGGTALALQINHRKSIDFDLFRFKSFDNNEFVKYLNSNWKNEKVTVINDVLDEYTFLINDTKITFLMYPFEIKEIKNVGGINLANPLAIGAMKAYALGRRAKWKDYVDIYFLLQNFSIEEIEIEASKIFATKFSPKLFRQQLSYFEDIDYTETIEWVESNEISNEIIKQVLKKSV